MLRSSAPEKGLRGERGAAAVEFALVLPMLIALMLGIISYGYMLSFRQGISQGAAEGARAAAVSLVSTPTGDRQVAAKDAVNQSLGGYNISCESFDAVAGTGVLENAGGTTVGSCSARIATCPNNAAKSCALVTVDYAYRDHPLLPSFPGLGATLPQRLDYTAVAEVSS